MCLKETRNSDFFYPITFRLRLYIQLVQYFPELCFVLGAWTNHEECTVQPHLSYGIILLFLFPSRIVRILRFAILLYTRNCCLQPNRKYYWAKFFNLHAIFWAIVVFAQNLAVNLFSSKHFHFSVDLSMRETALYAKMACERKEKLP